MEAAALRGFGAAPRGAEGDAGKSRTSKRQRGHTERKPAPPAGRDGAAAAGTERRARCSGG